MVATYLVTYAVLTWFRFPAVAMQAHTAALQTLALEELPARLLLEGLSIAVALLSAVTTTATASRR